MCVTDRVAGTAGVMGSESLKGARRKTDDCELGSFYTSYPGMRREDASGSRGPGIRQPESGRMEGKDLKLYAHQHNSHALAEREGSNSDYVSSSRVFSNNHGRSAKRCAAMVGWDRLKTHSGPRGLALIKHIAF